MSGLRLQGKVALITGASRGIGRAVADLFAEEGSTVVLCDIKSPAAALLEGQHFRSLDVTDSSAWQQLAESVETEFGPVKILVNNAGIVDYEPIVGVSAGAWKLIMTVNVDGVLFGMQSFIPQMIGSGGGSIVNISSIWGSYAVAGAAAYHASKGAVRNLTKNAAMTYVKQGIRANSVHPGIIATPHVVDVQERSISDVVVAHTPMGRMADPRELAYGVLFLASDEASFVTGTELYVDGGYTAQ
jgi:3alpha(or 20beta)-hydroxysteroid dehydrogenase